MPARYVDNSSYHHQAVKPPHVLPPHSIKWCNMIYSLWTRMHDNHVWTCQPIKLPILPCSRARTPGSVSL
eukprot:8057097-Prorocentrum_lima.AAC.1